MNHHIDKRRSTTSPDKLVADIMQYEKASRKNRRVGDPWDHVHQTEPVVLQPYLASKDSVSVSRHGLFVSDTYPFLATSTGGLLHEGGTVEMLEIECPVSDEPVEVLCCSHKTFCLEFDGSKFNVKKQHPYYDQRQMEMGITGNKCADLLVFMTTPEGQSFCVEQVSFNVTQFNRD